MLTRTSNDNNNNKRLYLDINWCMTSAHVISMITA